MLIIEPISTQQYAILSTSGHYGKRCKTLTCRLIRALSIVTSRSKRALEKWS